MQYAGAEDLVCKACAFGQHALAQNSSSCTSCFTSFSSDGKCVEAIALTVGAMLFVIIGGLVCRRGVCRRCRDGGRQKLVNGATDVYSESGEFTHGMRDSGEFFRNPVSDRASKQVTQSTSTELTSGGSQRGFKGMV